MNFQLKELSKNDDFSFVFDPGYLCSNKLYYAYFKVIPCNLIIGSLDLKTVREWIETNFKDEIFIEYSERFYSREKKENLFGEYYVFLKNGVLIDLFGDRVRLVFDNSLKDIANELQNQLLSFQIKRKRANEIFLITIGKIGFEKVSVEIKKPKIDLEKHYNSGFNTFHNRVLSHLRKENMQGLYLFYGKPGTGKSTYIKYLIQQQRKEVIFVSPKLAGELDSVAFTQFLLRNKNSILVIEEAEELILSRDSENNSGLSFILNLTDGILGESLGIQIIATFNTDIQNIDKALLRKGRLTEIYEFKSLSANKTNELLRSMGHEVELNHGLPLSEIFHFTEKEEVKVGLRKVIGFVN